MSPKPWNDRTKTHAERRALLDELVHPARRPGGAPPAPQQDWQVYEVDVRFPDHPDEPWKSGTTWELAAANEDVATRKALAHARQAYGLRSRLRGNTKKPRRVRVKFFPGPRHVIQLPSPLSVQGEPIAVEPDGPKFLRAQPAAPGRTPLRELELDAHELAAKQRAGFARRPPREGR